MTPDICTCSYCGIEEDIHLLDGVLTKDGEDSGKLACIKCYPVQGSWCPTGIEHIQISIATTLKPFYDEWLSEWRAKGWIKETDDAQA